MAWAEHNLRRTVEQEFRNASRLRYGVGAPTHVAPQPVERQGEAKPTERKRRIVKPKD